MELGTHSWQFCRFFGEWSVIDDNILNTGPSIPCGRNGLNVHVSQWNDCKGGQCTLSKDHVWECAAVHCLTRWDDEVAERLVKVSINFSVNKTIRLDIFNDQVGSQRIVDLICASIIGLRASANE